MKVIFSRRAMVSLLLEVQEHLSTETGGIFLGRYVDGDWYVVESIDPGPESVFQTDYFEYDHKYVNYLANKISQLYYEPLELMGLWHRHTGLRNDFSGIDDITNISYARMSKHGIISGVVNLMPEFTLSMYHVSLPLKYKKLEYEIGDNKFKPEIFYLHDEWELKKIVRNNLR